MNHFFFLNRQQFEFLEKKYPVEKQQKYQEHVRQAGNETNKQNPCLTSETGSNPDMLTANVKVSSLGEVS